MKLSDILLQHNSSQGALLQILHDVQEAFGHVSEEAVCSIAVALNLSRAEVHGVVSFYQDFTREPEMHPKIKLCRAEACQARGVEALLDALLPEQRARMGIVYCLGLCSVGPNAVRGTQVHARLDAERLATLLECTE